MASQCVYFLRDKRNCKIGLSVRPEERLSQLQTGNSRELSVISYVYGGRRHEAELHRIFEFCHVRGEWFWLHPILVQTIAHAERYNIDGAIELAKHHLSTMNEKQKRQAINTPPTPSAVKFDLVKLFHRAVELRGCGLKRSAVREKLRELGVSRKMSEIIASKSFKDNGLEELIASYPSCVEHVNTESCGDKDDPDFYIVWESHGDQLNRMVA